MNTHHNITLVLGGTGKTGRRVAQRLQAAGHPVRMGSRSGQPPFDWNQPETWAPALRHVASVYMTYYPDLAIPGAVDSVRAFTEQAKASGVQHLVLLSGRGEEEAQRAERVVQESGVNWTILRCSWFAQNFSENYLVDAVRSGEVVLPAGDVGEPFVDADDIAEVAVAALTEDGHAGQLYELTGPRLLTFAEAVADIAKATGREIRYIQVTPEQYVSGMAEEGVPDDFAWLLEYLFTTVLDGRNASLTDGVAHAWEAGRVLVHRQSSDRGPIHTQARALVCTSIAAERIEMEAGAQQRRNGLHQQMRSLRCVVQVGDEDRGKAGAPEAEPPPQPTTLEPPSAFRDAVATLCYVIKNPITLTQSGATPKRALAKLAPLLEVAEEEAPLAVVLDGFGYSRLELLAEDLERRGALARYDSELRAAGWLSGKLDDAAAAFNAELARAVVEAGLTWIGPPTVSSPTWVSSRLIWGLQE